MASGGRRERETARGPECAGAASRPAEASRTNMMREIVFAALSGLLFAAGLAIGGMTDPAKVRGFLDVFGYGGRWDPQLIFVMGGAVGVYALLARFRPRAAPTKKVDATLVAGAALFGVGWGLAGYCPGPAFASSATAGVGTLIFVVAMLCGLSVGRIVNQR